jgi:type IV pilus assembly protein PilN
MNVTLNLATRPFVELRPLLARLKLAMIALALVAIGLIVGLRLLKDKADAATAQMDALKSQTAEYQGRMLKNEARMKQPQNRAVLERAQFLNELFAKKSFSWTAVMMDLETVLPAGVQVTSIDPAISKEGDVTIRLRVTGVREKAVELVRNLEKSKRFLSPRLSNESLQANQQGTSASAAQLAGIPGGVQFDILSGYNPLSVEETKQMEAAGKSRAKSRSDDSAPAAAKRKSPAPPRVPHSGRLPKAGAR